MELSEKSTNHYTPAGWAPKQAPKKGGLGNFIWNSDTKEFMGRNGTSWCKITIFYLIFYAGLALFFMTSLMIFMTTLEDNKPRWMLDDSIIGSNPGVGFRPMPDQDKNTDSSLIWVHRQHEKFKSYWVDELEAYLEDYKDIKYNTSNTVDCSFYKDHAPYPSDDDKTSDRPCRVPVDRLQVCNSTNGYGYLTGSVSKPTKERPFQPCVLVKLNKIYGWKPEPYDSLSTLEKAKKAGMPKDLSKRIEDLISKAEGGSLVAKRMLQTVWITCEGENPADIENIGTMRYFAPGILGEFPGIPAYYFPYLMQDDYLSPFVFVQFTSLSLHTLVNVRCTAWADNIRADHLNRAGLVHFEFLVD